jgi:hypothetical protein
MKQKLQTYLKLGTLLFLAPLFLLQCMQDTIEETKHDRLETVSIQDANNFLNNPQIQRKTDASPYVTAYTAFTTQTDITNSNEMLTVVPAITTDANSYSRILLLNIDGNVEAVVYSMFSSNNFSTSEFYGDILITDLEGNYINGFKVEDGFFIARYISGLGAKSSSINYNVNAKSACGDCPFTDCDSCSLDEVVVEAKRKIDIGSLYTSIVPEATELAETIDAGPSGGGGGGFNSPENTCPPGSVKNLEGLCILIEGECEEGSMLNDNGECEEVTVENTPPDCESFEYSRVGFNDWQCSAVVGINELFYLFNWECTAWNIAFFTQPIYFQLPINYLYPLDTGSTKLESAIRLHYAFESFDDWYDEHGCEDNQGAAVEQVLLNYMKDEFEEIGGNVTMDPPLGFSRETTAYKKKWLGYGNCN